MDLLRKFLKVTFCKYDLNYLNCSCIKDKFIITDKGFLLIFRKEYPEISDDHIRLIYNMYVNEWRIYEGNTENIFNSILHFSDCVLSIKNKTPFLKHEMILKWRDVTEFTGEDLIVSAYLANQEKYFLNNRTSFDWPNVINNDDVNLKYLYKNFGLAELHHHLKASTSIFDISWICLMNHITRRYSEIIRISDNDEALDLYKRIVEAGKIRFVLNDFISNGKRVRLDDYTLSKSISLVSFDSKELQDEINAYKISMGPSKSYDYIKNVIEAKYVYTGERFFLYSLFKKIFRGGLENKYLCLFYRYLVIKNQLREKIVQFNKNIGFGNFDIYERRKECFLINYPMYSKLLKELPIYESQKYHNVKYIETRIAPSTDYKKITKNLQETKSLIEAPFGKEYLFDYHIIYHFIKKKDNNLLSIGIPRNHAVRMEIKKQSIVLKRILNKEIGNVIVGIDAANSEIYCRPEVFSQAFRYLRSSRLGFTYHVGEDFYDITDGLRAINEAISFLELRSGDRLGHCLALGIDPYIYYEKNACHLPIPKQNLLDNLVWLIHICKKYDIYLDGSLELMIMDKYEELLSYIYEHNICIEKYYKSMKLRSCSPYNIDFASHQLIDNWDSYSNPYSKKIKDIMADPTCKSIYLGYHMDEKIKRRGAEITEFFITSKYVDLINKVQDKMMEEIEKRQIIIECCPSSNFRIGQLDRYDRHPIFRFFNIDMSKGHHLPVTVNTDDLGLFSTSLDNEYGLLSLAALKRSNNDGKSYNMTQIDEWLKTIIANGWKFKFGV